MDEKAELFKRIDLNFARVAVAEVKNVTRPPVSHPGIVTFGNME